MTRRIDTSRAIAALRALDPAASTTLNEEEGRRADITLERIVAAPAHDPDGTASTRTTRSVRPRRRRVLVPAGLAGALCIGVVTTLGGGSAFGSWTSTPQPLPRATAATAAETCGVALDLGEAVSHVVLAERRGGWTYPLLDGTGGEAACLLPDELVGADGGSARARGFFGSYDTDPPAAPTPGADEIVETESSTGAVSLPGRLGIGRAEGRFTWVSGYAGADVARVIVRPPTGPEVQASLASGRFSAWWPSEESGDDPAAGGPWTYTVTLVDGTTRRLQAPY